MHFVRKFTIFSLINKNKSYNKPAVKGNQNCILLSVERCDDKIEGLSIGKITVNFLDFCGFSVIYED